jgi:hypothetical protein
MACDPGRRSVDGVPFSASAVDDIVALTSADGFLRLATPHSITTLADLRNNISPRQE